MNPHQKPGALQMWTVRQEAQHDFLGALEHIARLGYAGVEQVHSLGYGGLSATQVQDVLDDLGLQTVGAHITLQEWEADTEGILAFYTALSTRYVAVSWLEPERRQDEESYRQAAASIRDIATQCEESGLKLLYHHHDFEFVRFGGHTALDLISQIVGPERLGIEVDVHWVKRAGEDPAAFLRKMGARCPLVHFKDVTEHGLHTQDHEDTHAFTPLGNGILDFQALAEAARYAEAYIVEQDYCQGDPFETARVSLEYLKREGLAA